MVITERTAPTASVRRVSVPRDSATVSITPAKMRMPRGMLIPNAQCHEKAVVSQPPRSGPTAAMPPIVEPQTAKAMPRSRPRKVALISDSVVGRIIAPPTPCTKRAAISMPPEVDRAARIEDAAKMTTPISSIRFRPMRSATLPKTRSSAAKTSV